MTSEARPTFTCKVCGKVLTPKFLPSAAPNCPACGADTAPNQVAIDAGLTTFCANCHTTGNVYESDTCTNCGGDWGHWSGGDSVEQTPAASNENDRVIYQSTRGPEGGTVPRWKIV